ncbi:TPA: hypothetical protein ACSIS3_003822 [Acinetobacter baumannii]
MTDFNYEDRIKELELFNKWADFEGLDTKMSSETEHSSKETHLAFLAWIAAKAQAVQQSFEIGRLQDRITELLDERQDLYAQINNDQAVPEGYVLLPRVPTEKMFQAYERYSVAPMSTLSKTGYKAMVEAAGDQNENS